MIGDLDNPRANFIAHNKRENGKRSITFALVVIVALVFANALFAMAEIALVSARETRAQPRAKEGHARAHAALDRANDPKDFLTTMEVGITPIGILAGALGGATGATERAARFRGDPALELYSDALGLGLVVLGSAYLLLVIGKLGAKQLGLNHPEQIALAPVPLMRLLSGLTFPRVWVLSNSTDEILRLLGTLLSKGV